MENRNRRVIYSTAWFLNWWLHGSLLFLALTVWSCAPEPRPTEWHADAYVDSLSNDPGEEYKKARFPREFSFPAEHGAHPDYLTEWWYFTGFVKSRDGKDYGYQLTFFRFSLTPPDSFNPGFNFKAFKRSGILMGHFAVTDVTANSFSSFERFSREGAGLAGVEQGREVRIWLDNWAAKVGTDGSWSLFASAGEGIDTVSIDLELQTDTSPILHGDRGHSRKGREEGQANYYYSLIHLDTQGTFNFGKQTVSVSGSSWMDHEWGTSALPDGSSGWDWFGLQLEDGTALMLASVRMPTSEVEPSFVNSLYSNTGELHKLYFSQVYLEAKRYWQSPSTGIVYPAAWDLNVPDYQLKCRVEPLVADQEFSGLSAYWEGLVFADCSLEGVPVTGYGYVELTGYGNEVES